MTPEPHQRIRELFDAAIELPAEDRAAFLDEHCADDPDLRAEVESLLEHEQHVRTGFLDPPDPPGQPTTPLVDAAATVRLIGQTIGQYKIRRVIASGGMGTVFEAMQKSPRRVVALKVMKHGIAAKSALRRFEYESQILARLRHPGIAQVYEAGTHNDGTGPVPYFAMEYVPNALPITEFAKQKKLSTRERLELFVNVCDAVHHGHQKGIIHRDLKPGNILVDSHGQPKVIDFGVARATDSDMAVTTLQTDVGQLIGTLQYMSPEQCDADPHNLDTRSDVYALGVVLYEMLCEHLPYDVTKVALYEAARVIREEPPTRPSSFNKTLRGDVETIALKSLEKERERRYRSAADFGDDIGRYLRSEPITARPASILDDLKIFIKRHTKVFIIAIGIVIGLMAGTAFATVWWYIPMRHEISRTQVEAIAERWKRLAYEMAIGVEAPPNTTDVPLPAAIKVLDQYFDVTLNRSIGAAHGYADLYDIWHETEPDVGHDISADKWRGLANALRSVKSQGQLSTSEPQDISAENSP